MIMLQVLIMYIIDDLESGVITANVPCIVT